MTASGVEANKVEANKEDPYEAEIQIVSTILADALDAFRVAIPEIAGAPHSEVIRGEHPSLVWFDKYEPTDDEKEILDCEEEYGSVIQSLMGRISIPIPDSIVTQRSYRISLKNNRRSYHQRLREILSDRERRENGGIGRESSDRIYFHQRDITIPQPTSYNYCIDNDEIVRSPEVLIPALIESYQIERFGSGHTVKAKRGKDYLRKVYREAYPSNPQSLRDFLAHQQASGPGTAMTD